jgi:dTDP-4-amino-4,6-dideoxygalactose transaminase
MSPIPVMRPLLPSLDRLTPYFERIDRARFYTNFGPLVSELEDRLAAHYGLPAGTVSSVANATLGLTIALTAQGAQPGTLCAMPGWTFIASAHAAVNAGLIPYFIDVDRDTWALDASAIAEQIARAPAPVGAVMPVAPFGLPIDVSAWDGFHAETGIPVVIDAAAGFDSLVPGDSPAVISLHATKVLGSGEGGLVVSRDSHLIRRVRTASNFGFNQHRQADVPATNAKMSEYHAAVGHAALDDWGEARATWMSVAGAYRSALDGSNQVRFQESFGESWISSTCVLRVVDEMPEQIDSALAALGIETRRWWSKGAHTHPATAQFPRGALPVTDMLARSTIGVPFYRDLDSAGVGRAASAILSAI